MNIKYTDDQPSHPLRVESVEYGYLYLSTEGHIVTKSSTSGTCPERLVVFNAQNDGVWVHERSSGYAKGLKLRRLSPGSVLTLEAT